MAQHLQLRAPSGSRLRVTLPDEPSVTSVSTYAQFAGGAYSRLFQVGARGFQEIANRELVPATVVDRLALQRGEVVVATSADGDVSTAAWIGPYHEAMTVFTGPAPPREAILSVFAQFRFDDNVAGLRMTPSKHSGIDLVSEGLTVVVGDRGYLSIPEPRNTRSIVPSHRGSKTSYGEVWRASKVPEGEPTPVITSPGPRDYLYILATARGAAQVDFFPEASATDQQLLDWLEAIDIAWQ
jgi:hypothetical protein